MSYYETLAHMVKKSGLTLKEIAEKCEDYGVSITPAYISRLQTGKQSPASEEVNTALAKVCGGNIEQFVYEAHMEKAPEVIRQFIDKMLDLLKTTMVQGVPDHIRPFMIEQLKQMSDISLVNNFLEMQLPKVADNNSFITQDHDSNDYKYKVFRFAYTMEDDSMEPKIPKNSFLEISEVEKPEIGDIVAVKLEDGTIVVRRYISTATEEILISDNKNFKPIILDKKTHKNIRKVKSIYIDV